MSKELLKVIDFDRLSVTLITEDNNLYETFVLSKDYGYTELKEGVQYPMEGSLMKRVVQFRQLGDRGRYVQRSISNGSRII